MDAHPKKSKMFWGKIYEFNAYFDYLLKVKSRRQAFESVEKDYLDSIDGILAHKTKLQCEIPDGISHNEV